jgi:uncharacterized membrane protein YjgN (DUF898 family)
MTINKMENLNTTTALTNSANSTDFLNKAFDGKPDDWAPNAAIQNKPVRFKFSGRGQDFLSLWLTNWILTIATLGIYSAWAKARRLQYTHQNTQLGGYAFNFHGNPRIILIGRIIAVFLLVMASVGDFFQEFSTLVSISSAFYLILMLGYPWFMRSSMRFQSRNSSYRNVRFKFKGKLGNLYAIYIFGGLLVLITMGLAFPYLAYRLRRYRIENNYWGNNKFDFNATTGAFFGIYFLHIAITIVLYAIVFGVAMSYGYTHFGNIENIDQATGELSDPATQALIFVIAVIILFFMLYKVATSITQDWIFKTSWNHTSIAKSQFSCDLNVFVLYIIRFACFTLSLFTLGLFTPFAHMIIAKRRIESLSLTPAHDFDLEQASLDADTTRSAEVAEMMDFDLTW